MKDKSDIVQQASDAVCQLFQVLQQLIGISMNNCLQDIPGQIVHLSNQVSQVETKQQQSLNSLDAVKQLIENTVSANVLLERAGQTNLLLGKEHYEKHIIEPMLRSLLPVVDIIEDSRKHNNLCHCSSAKVLDSIYSQVLQFLSNYGIDIFSHSPGDKFDAHSMKPVKWELTPETSLNNAVAKSLQSGFRFEHARILRLETVSLFKYKPSENENNNFNERIEK